MSAIEMHAGWALHGKRRDSSADFGLLASTPGYEKDFGAALFALRPGNPDTTVPAGRPAALPWVSIGAFARRSTTIGVALIRPAADGRRDKTRRPVAMTSYFEIEYAQGAAAQVGYEALRHAVWDVELPEESGPEVRVLVEPVALADFVDWAVSGLGEAGVDWLARVAACLLERSVVIDGGPIEVAKRLSVFDAIAALLPYGLRADLSVSTWVQYQRPESARLAFGAANDRVIKITWGKVPDHVLSDEPKEYYERLTDLLRHPKWGTRTTVDRLARIRRPLSFARLNEVLDALGELDFAINVAQKIRADQGSIEEARAVLARHAPEDLDDDDCAVIVTYAVPRLPNAELPRLLTRYWSPLIWDLLAVEALRTSDAERREQIVQVAAQQPVDEQVESPFEQLLLAVAARVAADDDEGQRVLARMMARFSPPPRVGLWSRLRQVLVERPQWSCALVEAVATGSPSDAQWLMWIANGDWHQSPRWLTALWSAIVDDQRFTFDDAAELARLDGYGIRIAVRLATRHNRLAAVIPALWTPIHNRALDFGHRDEDLIGDVLRTARHLTPGVQAAVDVLLVELSHGLAAVPSDRRREEWPEYHRAAADFLHRAAARATTPADQAVRFVDAILAAGLRLAPSDVQCVEFSIGLATAVADMHDPMLGHVAMVCAPRAVELLTALPDSMQDVMVGYSPELRQVRAREALRRHAQENQSLAVLARDWLRLAADGGGAADAVQILAEAWPHAHDYRSARRLLDELRREGDVRYPDHPQYVDDRFCDGFEAILQDGLGQQVATDLRKATAAYVRREERVLERLDALLRGRGNLVKKLLGRK